VQFQPRRAARLDPSKVLELIASIAIGNKSLVSFEFNKGHDRGPYVNFFFCGSRAALRRTWQDLRLKILAHRRFGVALRKSTIITCEGTRGWDNYLLLHHFDERLTRDKLPDI
jgi:hypothetical protein